MKTKTLFAIILAALMITACGGQSQTSAVVPTTEETTGEEAAMDETQAQEPVEAEQPAMEETNTEEAAPEQPTAADTAYTSPEGLFSLEISAGWIKNEDPKEIEDTIIESFSSPDGHAHVQVLVDEIGTKTTAVEKAQYTRDYLKRLCGSDIDFTDDVAMDNGLEQLVWGSEANGTSGSAYFGTKENFLFFANMYYDDAYEDTYTSALKDTYDSMVIFEEPVAMEKSKMAMNSYTSPESLFTLDVPADWAKTTDTSTLEKSTIDTFASPDGHAYVQVVVNKVNDDVSAVEKGQFTLDFMKRLYGKNLHVADGALQKSGLERLNWWVDETTTSGSTYFDTKDGFLYFFSTYSEDDYADIYTATMKDVTDSYSEQSY